MVMVVMLLPVPSSAGTTIGVPVSFGSVSSFVELSVYSVEE